MAGGPDRDIRFKRYRVTSGHYTASGITFRITDDWLRAGNAHRALKESWVGQTHFSEIPDYIEDSMDAMRVKIPEMNFRDGRGGISSLGPLRARPLDLPQPVRDFHHAHPRALDLLQPVRDLHHAHPAHAHPLAVRERPGLQQEMIPLPDAYAGVTHERRVEVAPPLAVHAGTKSRDPAQPLCEDIHMSRRLRDRRGGRNNFDLWLGISSTRVDPSRASGIPLFGIHRCNNIIDPHCGRRAHYRARVRGGVLRSGDDMAGWPLVEVSRIRRMNNGRTGKPKHCALAWLKSHSCGAKQERVGTHKRTLA